MNRPRSADFHVDGKPLSWSAKDRADALKQAQTRDFGMIIIGGGITGASIAREAALRGIPFLLVDKEDFAFGTSSRSSKLAHGGIRYLSQGDFGLVRESTQERNWLRHALPNLVRPLGFYFCAYKGGKDTPRKVKTGILLYDFLSNTFARFKNAAPHRFFKATEMATREPAVATQDLLLAGLYYDTNVDDSRLTLETLKEARDASGGLSVALNYVRAGQILTEDGHVSGVELEDLVSGQHLTVRARCVVNATGIWTDETLKLAGIDAKMIRPTKGVHVVVPNARLGNREAFGLRSIDDGRFFFVLRRGDVSVIGTTDTDYTESLDQPWCDQKDCDYLLRTVNTVFPEARITYDDILSTYAGIRPLIRQEGQSESSVSRRHVLLDSGNGLVTIAGGKLTTFRTMGWELLSLCAKRGYIRALRGSEKRRNFSRRPFKVGTPWEAFQASLRELKLQVALPEATQRHLHQQYGQGAVGILREVQQSPRTGEPLLEGHPFCAAEIHHILTFESAPHLTDVMLRRTEMQMLVSHKRQGELAGRVAGIMACFYGWDETRTQEELAQYLAYIRKTIFF